MSVPVAIVGVSGFSGIELVRLIAARTDVTLTAAFSDRWKGDTLGAHIPGLVGSIASLVVRPQAEATRAADDADVVLLATPAEVSAELAPAVLAGGKRVLDLSGAFRLPDPAVFRDYYGFDHPEPELCKQAHYGLPELPRAAGDDAPPIRSARLVANPGCYATAAILPLAPLLAGGLVEPRGLFVDGKSGVTGAGRKVAEKYLFTEVSENVTAYRVAHHQHTPEIELALSRVAGRDVSVTFAPHLIPIRRGLVSTCFGTLAGAPSAGVLEAALQRAYASEPQLGGEPLVRVAPPEQVTVQAVANTPRALVGAREDLPRGTFVAMGAIDNLLKGAASQAIQNLARMLALGCACLLAVGCSDVGEADGTGSSTEVGNGSGGSTGALPSTVSVAGSGGDDGNPCSEPYGDVPALRLEPVLTDIGMAISMAVDPARPSRWYVAERTGVVHVVDDGVILPEPFLDVSAEVSCCENDRGFFDIVLAPDFATSKLFYVHYSQLASPFSSTTILAEYRVSPTDEDVADPVPVRQLLALPQNTVWHYGGAISFGPLDGLLYYPRGDGGGVGDPEGDARNPANPYGKILRLDLETFPEAPGGNPPGFHPLVWSIGLRNPWQSSFDRCTGDFYIGDVGQSTYEEIDVLAAGEHHVDFGWNELEGDQCFMTGCDPSGTLLPVLTFPHSQGYCAIIGGHTYRGHAMPGLRGRYFFGDICSRRIHSFRYVNGAATDLRNHTTELDTLGILGEGKLGAFGEDADGEIYVLDMGGTVYRIAPR